ncbi:MBL fold metallo-hydrolase [Solibacillus sp. FSL H8-0538]|uniref:MBL fold metallo-hydrolase n=1 Tax=Solibacillus sp. FSL H8-0538 TaxID=2921400 RepID=UPI0030F72E1C
MKIFPLGVGGAFTSRFYHNNFIVQIAGKNLLIDAGTTLRYSLNEAKFELKEINLIFITHLHFDHFGGLEELLLKGYWNFVDGQHQPLHPTLIMHPNQYDELISHLTPGLINQQMKLEDFCQIVFADEQNVIHQDSFTVKLINTTGLHIEDMASYALQITEQQTGKNILYSADIKQLSQSYFTNYINEKTVAIFQDTSFFGNGVHATLEEVLAYYPEQSHSLLFAMHYEDAVDETAVHLIKLAIQGKSINF